MDMWQQCAIQPAAITHRSSRMATDWCSVWLDESNEAAEALRLSRSVLYELIRSGRLRTVKQGRRRLVPVSALAEYVDSLGRRT